MLYIMVNEDRPASEATPIRDATREAHLAYLERHKNIVVLAGGTLAEDGKTRTGSVFIVNVTSREAAEKFSAEERAARRRRSFPPKSRFGKPVCSSR